MLKIVHTLDDAMELKRWLSTGVASSSVAIDTETSGVDHHDPSFKVRLLQLGTANEAWVIPFERWVGLADELLTAYRGQIIMHNSRFDIAALATHGVKVDWSRVDDTMIAVRLAEPTQLAGLKQASVRHVSGAAAGGQKDLHDAMKKNKWTWATVPIDFWLYIYYAAMDTVLTARLAKAPAIKAGFMSPVYPLEMEVREVCSIMENRGMRVDQDFCADASRRLRDEASELHEKTQAAYGFSLSSNDELSRWLMSNGATITTTTPGGKPSVAKESLELVLARDDLPDRARFVVLDALRARKVTKMASSYFDNFLDLSDGDGFVHPSIETVAARTGRMSIRDPALQTLPRVSEDPDSKLVRTAVLPRQENEVLVSSDYEQIELRLIAALSKDPSLISAFDEADNGDTDFFTAATRQVYEEPSILKQDERRSTVKALFYAASYGAGVKKMAQTAHVSVEEMQSVKDRVFSRYPGLDGLIRRAERECKSNGGWVTTQFGRRLYVDPEFAYKANNAIIQGTAADVLKVAVVNMAQAGLEDMMVVPVHDEILLSVPEEDLDEVAHTTEEAMAELRFSVPLIAKPSGGYKSWGTIPK